jgi:cytochrome c556
LRVRLWPILVGAFAATAGGAAYAQFSAKDAVGARVGGYRETGAAFKTLNDQLKSDTPLKVMLRTSARRITQTSHDQYDWYPRGSGPESGEKTKAKAAVWTDAAGFKAAQDGFQQQAGRMSQAVDAGDLGQMKAAAHALGEACAACHDKVRERE